MISTLGFLLGFHTVGRVKWRTKMLYDSRRWSEGSPGTGSPGSSSSRLLFLLQLGVKDISHVKPLPLISRVSLL